MKDSTIAYLNEQFTEDYGCYVDDEIDGIFLPYFASESEVREEVIKHLETMNYERYQDWHSFEAAEQFLLRIAKGITSNKLKSIISAWDESF